MDLLILWAPNGIDCAGTVYLVAVCPSATG